MSYTNSAQKKIASDYPNCSFFKTDLDLSRIIDPSDYEVELVDKLEVLKRSKNLELWILNTNLKAKRAVLYTCLYYGLFDGKERKEANVAKLLKRSASVVKNGINHITKEMRSCKAKRIIADETGKVASNLEKNYDNYADFLQSCIDDEQDPDVIKRLSKIKKDCIEYHADKDIIK